MRGLLTLRFTLWSILGLPDYHIDMIFITILSMIHDAVLCVVGLVFGSLEVCCNKNMFGH